MKIVAPFSRVNEVEMLLHWGADELYCGVHTPEWQAHFGTDWWMNRRSPEQANILSQSDMKTALDLAHHGGVPVYLAMNTPFYPDGSTDYMVRLARELAESLGIDGLIVSDINFLLQLRQLNLPVRLHMSSLGGVINSRTVRFYQSLGIRRIILPRQMRVPEIRRIIDDSPDDMEFEVFAVNDGCFFEEGYCQTTHAFGPFCMNTGPVSRRTGDAADFPDAAIQAVTEAMDAFLWYQNNCGSSVQKDGLPNGPCSLCRFGEFREMGVSAVKIVGREASFQRKMASLQLVKTVMDAVRNGEAAEEIAALSRTLRNTPEYCDTGYMCYFRDA